MKGFGILLRRELALAWGKGGGPLLALTFYACVVVLLPMASGRAPERLAAIAPGIAWLALALAALLSLERLFERDYEDGALDLLTLSSVPLEIACAIKCLGQWLATAAPLAFAAPVAAIALGAKPHLAPLIFACALMGGLAFAFVGGIGAALMGPTWQSIVPELVPRTDLKSAVALNSLGINIARAIGPAAGGLLLASFGAATAYGADVLSYVFVIAALL